MNGKAFRKMNAHRLAIFIGVLIPVVLAPFLCASEQTEPKEKAKIDINCAAVEQLCLLPGIDQNLAAAIVAHRVEKGIFKCIQDLLAVPGITQTMLKELSPLLLEMPANSCTIPEANPGDHDWEEHPIMNIPNC